ncbi:MAG: GNAT family N-acetyltransferase [Pseudomonadota bacterium]
MSAPEARDLYAAIEATWPAAHIQRVGPWAIRDGQGGGKRVSAASAEVAVTPDDLAQAEAAMAALGQGPLFWIRAGDEALDAMLAEAGYRVIDPVTLYCCDIDTLAATPPPPVSTFVMPEPLAIMREIWAEGGIGPDRLAVMDRAADPKTLIFGRSQNRPAGAGFVGLHGRCAMVHAVEVRPAMRRQGTAGNMMRAAGVWAARQGATHLALAVTTANTAANALYRALGMQVAGRYHYRIKTGDTP